MPSGVKIHSLRVKAFENVNGFIDRYPREPKSHAGSRTQRALLRQANLVRWVGKLCVMCLLAGCTSTAKMHLWQPPMLDVPSRAKVAVAPIAGKPTGRGRASAAAGYELPWRIEKQLLAATPPAKDQTAVFTAEELIGFSPIQLASTAPLSHDIVALQAAREIDADVLLHGEILQADLTMEPETDTQQPVNMNKAFFHRVFSKKSPPQTLLIGWRVIDVDTGKHLGDHTIRMTDKKAVELYPNLEAIHDNATDIVLAAAAREAWKAISPSVIEQEVKLVRPWFQWGAWRVRQGVEAAKLGQWQMAQAHWEKAASSWLAPPAAHYNLALAHAAREDFAQAKEHLLKARGLRGSTLPKGTLFWLDQQHRRYHQALDLGAPAEGWLFLRAGEVRQPISPAEPIDIADLPWWTAIPFTPLPEP